MKKIVIGLHDTITFGKFKGYSVYYAVERYGDFMLESVRNWIYWAIRNKIITITKELSDYLDNKWELACTP